jgi:hypothetical protein
MELKKVAKVPLGSKKILRYDEDTVLLLSGDQKIKTVLDISNPLDIKEIPQKSKKNLERMGKVKKFGDGSGSFVQMGNLFAFRNKKLYYLYSEYAHRNDDFWFHGEIPRRPYSEIFIIDASKKDNIKQVDKIKLDTRVSVAAMSEKGVLYAINTSGELGTVDERGHFTALYNLDEGLSGYFDWTHPGALYDPPPKIYKSTHGFGGQTGGFTVIDNFLLIPFTGNKENEEKESFIFSPTHINRLEIYDIQDTGTIKLLRKIEIERYSSSFSDLKSVFMYEHKYILRYGLNKLLIIDLANKNNIKIKPVYSSEMDLRIHSWQGFFFYQQKSERRIILSGEKNSYFTIYVADITGDNMVIEQEIRPDSINEGCIINKDNYLLNINQQFTEVFEITDGKTCDKIVNCKNSSQKQYEALFKKVIQNMNDYQKLIPEDYNSRCSFHETEEMIKLDKILFDLLEKIKNEPKPINLKYLQLNKIKDDDGKTISLSFGESFYRSIMEMHLKNSRGHICAVLLELLPGIELAYTDYNYIYDLLINITKNFFKSLWFDSQMIIYDYEGYKIKMLSWLKAPEASLLLIDDICDLRRYFLSLLTVLDDTYKFFQSYNSDILDKTINFLYQLPKSKFQINFDRTYFYSTGIRIAITQEDVQLKEFCLEQLPKTITESCHALSLAFDASHNKDKDAALKYMDIAFNLSNGVKFHAAYESILFKDIVRDKDFYKYIYW